MRALVIPNQQEKEEANAALARQPARPSSRRSQITWMLTLGIFVLIFVFSYKPKQPASPTTQQSMTPTQRGQAAYLRPALAGLATGLATTIAIGFWRRPRRWTIGGGKPQVQEQWGWTDEGIVEVKEGVTILTKWSMFVDYLVTERTYILCVAADRGVIIPIRGLAGPQGQAELVSTLDLHLCRRGAMGGAK